MNERSADHCTRGGAQEQGRKDRQNGPAVDYSGTSGFHLLHGRHPKIRRVSRQPLAKKREEVPMTIALGIVIMLAGLALAVMLGIVLYRDPRKEAQTARTTVGIRRDAETA